MPCDKVNKPKYLWRNNKVDREKKFFLIKSIEYYYIKSTNNTCGIYNNY